VFGESARRLLSVLWKAFTALDGDCVSSSRQNDSWTPSEERSLPLARRFQTATLAHKLTRGKLHAVCVSAGTCPRVGQNLSGQVQY